VARDYLASGRAGQPAGFSYLGPVFRYRGGQPSEFLQAGIESFGRQDRAAADAEMLALALEATSAFGLKDVEIRTGDVALFTALIDALKLYPVWRRRLIGTSTARSASPTISSGGARAARPQRI
jgi:ATP phosphoribosyltransferase regulatory subunit